MKYYVDVDGRPHEVDVVERMGELEVQVGGQAVAVSYEVVDRLGQVALLVDGKSYGVSIEGDELRCTVTIAGDAYSVLIEDEREHAAHAAERERSRGGGTVTSVMPGVVVQLLVAEGDTVEEGQPLLILEAMKMQNEIGAPGAGRVKRIHVAEREVVSGGQALLVLEPLPED